jgi:hypothetical protein
VHGTAWTKIAKQPHAKIRADRGLQARATQPRIALISRRNLGEMFSIDDFKKTGTNSAQKQRNDFKRQTFSV